MTDTTRQRLPNRRYSEFIGFKSMGMEFTASISRFPDGRLGELFCDNHKAGSAIGTLVRDSAIILSFALQHNADVKDIARALCRDSAGRPLGPIAQALDLLLADEGGEP
jgi:ribonucleoside-diphosphate reductase alpha chain